VLEERNGLGEYPKARTVFEGMEARMGLQSDLDDFVSTSENDWEDVEMPTCVQASKRKQMLPDLK
jgi:hypothetical protein